MNDKLTLLQRILNGEIFQSARAKKYRRLALMIAALIFLRVMLGFVTEWQYMRISNLKKELQDSRNEELNIGSELMNSSRQSAVATALKKQGSDLREANKPVIQIN